MGLAAAERYEHESSREGRGRSTRRRRRRRVRAYQITTVRHAPARSGLEGKGGPGPKRRRAIAPSWDENTENRLEKAT